MPPAVTNYADFGTRTPNVGRSRCETCRRLFGDLVAWADLVGH